MEPNKKVTLVKVNLPSRARRALRAALLFAAWRRKPQVSPMLMQINERSPGEFVFLIEVGEPHCDAIVIKQRAVDAPGEFRIERITAVYCQYETVDRSYGSVWEQTWTGDALLAVVVHAGLPLKDFVGFENKTEKIAKIVLINHEDLDLTNSEFASSATNDYSYLRGVITG